MGRGKKRPRKQPSLIDSETDCRFSPSYESESSDPSSDSSSASTHRRHKTPAQEKTPAPPPAHPKTPLAPTHGTSSAPATINYIIAAFSTSDMKKAVSKHRSKTSSLQL